MCKHRISLGDLASLGYLGGLDDLGHLGDLPTSQGIYLLSHVSKFD
jgi:hypothetical protein